MNRIISILIFCCMVATALASALAFRILLDFSTQLSIVIAAGLLVSFLLIQFAIHRQRRIVDLEMQIVELSEQIEKVDQTWHILLSRLQDCEEKTEHLSRAHTQPHDNNTSTEPNTATIGPLITQMIEVISDLDMRIEEQQQILTQKPHLDTPPLSNTSGLDEEQVSAVSEMEEPNTDNLLDPPDIKATKPIKVTKTQQIQQLLRLREILNNNSPQNYELQPIMRLPQRQHFADYIKPHLLSEIGPKVMGPNNLNQLAKEHHLMPLIDMAVIKQALQYAQNRVDLYQNHSPFICPLSLESFQSQKAFKPLRQLLEKNQAYSRNLVFEFLETQLHEAWAHEEAKLKTYLLRIHELGYKFCLTKDNDLNMKLDLSILNQLGFRFIRAMSTDLHEAMSALDEDAAPHMDIHPCDFAKFSARYHIEFIVDGLNDEHAILETSEFEPSLGMGSVFAQSRESLMRQAS